jgi:hypothetical protein
MPQIRGRFLCFSPALLLNKSWISTSTHLLKRWLRPRQRVPKTVSLSQLSTFWMRRATILLITRSTLTPGRSGGIVLDLGPTLKAEVFACP